MVTAAGLKEKGAGGKRMLLLPRHGGGEKADVGLAPLGA